MDTALIIKPSELSALIEESVRKVLENSTAVKADSREIPELMNVAQASEYLSLAKQTLYGFTSTGKIPYIKRDKKLYFKKSELNKWLLEGKKL